MVTRFVLLSTQRSGSTWVIEMLNSHPAVKAYEELFLEQWKERPTWVGERDVPTWQAFWAREQAGLIFPGRLRACFAYLDQVYHTEQRAIRAVGFKLMYGQLRRQLYILFYMLGKRVSIVHLIRGNFLDVILSEEALAARGVPHAYGGVRQVRITLDTSGLVDRIAWKERKVQWAQRIFSHLGLPCLELTYEGLLSQQEDFDMVLQFLGVEPSHYELRASLKKLSQGTHRDILENYDEVKRALEGSRYLELLRK